MIEKIKVSLLLLLAIFCITVYFVSFTGSQKEPNRTLASEYDEFEKANNSYNTNFQQGSPGKTGN